MSWAIYKRAHIRLDAVFDLVSERIEGLLYLFGNAMVLLFALLTLNYSIPLVFTSLEFGATTQALRVNRAFFQAAIPLGFALLSIRVLQRSYYDVRDIRSGDPVFKGEAIFLDDEGEGPEEPTATERENGATTEGGR
jgi:TRAP-type C4-dicarboxylate transport system permease small subunit